MNGKITNFPKMIFEFFFYFFKLIWVGPGLPIFIWAGPGPTIRAEPLLQGWAQPSRVGWADDPACGHHGLQKRAQCTFCMQGKEMRNRDGR